MSVPVYSGTQVDLPSAGVRTVAFDFHVHPLSSVGYTGSLSTADHEGAREVPQLIFWGDGVARLHFRGVVHEFESN